MFSRPFKRAVQVLPELERERYCAKNLTMLELKARLRCNTYDRDILKVLWKLVSAGLVEKTIKNELY